ncbi:IS5 family transposase [Hymenobacter jeollabukensis]|uniref:IS5 family transposase n=1 Tax=Hymenobacter jeollabukensis TaxID=2025313 RepID=A0A5R8WQF1_9BACT|nr:IS5 family transposase [Hymenobacter jeollabukensis]TLM92975.1 IS5 family transposase [Hymenobacter jeollabukensis]
MVDGYQPLTDSQWQGMLRLLPVQRKRRLCLRRVVDAVLYVCRTGCQWRSLPAAFPKWTAVYYYFRRWQQDGTLQRLNRALNEADRQAHGQAASPAVLCLDSQSVKLAPRIAEHRGTDGGKCVNGRKRQVLVDRQGRVWACRTHAANQHDSRGAAPLLLERRQWGPRLTTVVTDRAYRGHFAEGLLARGLRHEVSSRPPSVRGFVPVGCRWVVERTFAWLNFFRRLAMDYEYTPESHAAWILWANVTLCLNRLL